MRRRSANLPARIQNLVYEEPEPILLKCAASPHVYLLEDGAKRWIKDIPTFEAEGFNWYDVRYVSCDDLRVGAGWRAHSGGCGVAARAVMFPDMWSRHSERSEESPRN